MKYKYRYSSVIVESSKPLDSAFFAEEITEKAANAEKVIPEGEAEKKPKKAKSSKK